jgi:MFS family permease
MKNIRTALLFILLPFAAAFGSGGYYGARSQQWQWMYSMGFDSDPTSLYFAGAMAMAAGYVLAGVLSAAVTPHAVAILGAISAGATTLLLVVSPGSTVLPMLMAMSFCRGLGSGGLIGVVVVHLGRSDRWLRNGLAAAVYAGVNVGAFAAPTALGWLNEPQVGFGLSATLYLVSAGAMAGLVAGLWFARDDSEMFVTRLDSRVIGASAALIPFFLAGAVGYELVADHIWSSYYDHHGHAVGEWVYLINPAVVLVVSVLLFIGCLVVHFLRLPVPTTFVIGFGSLGMAAAGLASFGLHGEVLGLASMAFISMVEPLALVFVVSRLAGEMHWRIGAFVAAAWYGSLRIPSLALYAVREADVVSPTVWIGLGIGLAGVSGLVLIVAGVVLRVVYDAPEDVREEEMPTA